MTNKEYHKSQNHEDFINGTVKMKFINSTINGETEVDELIHESKMLRDMINRCVHHVNNSADVSLRTDADYTERYCYLVDAYNLTIQRINYLRNKPELLDYNKLNHALDKNKTFAEIN